MRATNDIHYCHVCVVVAVAAIVTTMAVSVGAAGTGTGADEIPPPPEADATISSGGTYFVGQVLYTDFFEADDDVVLEYVNGSFVSEIGVGPDGKILIDTTRYGAGSYVLSDSEGDRLSFQVTRQKYAVTVSDESVLSAGPNTKTGVTVLSNRARYRQVVTGSDLDARTIVEIFDDSELRDVDGDGDGEAVLLGGSTSKSYKANFDGVKPGTYTFTFQVTDTVAEDSTEISVDIYPDGTATITTGGDVLRVQRGTNRRIGGTTTLPSGTRLEIVVENVGGQTFRRSQSVVVQNGELGASFDFSGVPVGQEFEVLVRQDTVIRDRVPGQIVRPASIGSGSVSDDGIEVRVSELTLPSGGFVVLTDTGGTRFGATGYLEPGDHENVTVSLNNPLRDDVRQVVVRLHRDTDGDRRLRYSSGDRDEPYRSDGTAITSLARRTVPTPTVSPTPSPTPGPTPTATGTASPTTTTTASPTTTATGSQTSTESPGATDGNDQQAPGFGVVVALVGLASLAVLAYRRRTR